MILRSPNADTLDSPENSEMNRRPERYAGWHSMLVWPRTSSDWCRGLALSVFLFLCLLVFTSTTFGQTDITLRFLDADTGKPLKGIGVSVDAWDENEGRQKPPPAGVIKIDKNSQIVATDKEGRGIFRLYYEPALITLYIFSTDLRGCSSTHRFSIEEVRRTGAVASYEASKPKWCGQLKAHATAKPGELVIFDKRLTLWDRMLQEIP